MNISTKTSEAKTGLELSIVIPCYNEEKRIGKTLSTILAYLRRREIRAEVIVVDDGSTDRTCESVRQFTRPEVALIHYALNRGKGYAVKQGVLAARGEWVLFCDADLSTPIEEYEKFLSLCPSDDVLIASRGLAASDVQVRQPFYREGMGRIFNKFVRLALVRGIYDTQCGFKLFSREVAFLLFSRLQTEGFAFDVEILHRAQRIGLRIKEIPVTWVNDRQSKVHLIRDSVGMFLQLCRIWLDVHHG